MKEWVKGCDMGFYVGQELRGVIGDAIITVKLTEQEYDFIVRITSGVKEGYEYSIYEDGRLCSYDELPTFYSIELAPKFYQPEWQPKEGEWCWFWNDNKIPTIRRFKSMLPTECKHPYLDEQCTMWNNCAPFDKDNMTPPWERGAEG